MHYVRFRCLRAGLPEGSGCPLQESWASGESFHRLDPLFFGMINYTLYPFHFDDGAVWPLPHGKKILRAFHPGSLSKECLDSMR
jgi:hypothetical protein